MTISVVVPLFNEAPNVVLLHNAIGLAMSGLSTEYEILFVDDGSTDDTFKKCLELTALDHHLKAIRLRRNFGQTPAMAAGIDHASGEVIVTLDGDLQNDPGDIHLLLEQLEQGFDIAVGWRHERRDKLIRRRVPSRIANWLIGKVTGVPIRDNGCSLKAFRRATIKSVPLYSEMHRFIPAMASLTGARVVEVKVRHHPRRYGVSKYGLNRIYKVLVDLLTVKMLISCGSRPLHWFACLCIAPMLAGIIGFAYSTVQYLRGGSYSIVIGGTSVILLSAVIMLLINGALCELIYRTGDRDLSRLALASVRNREKQEHGH